MQTIWSKDSMCDAQKGCRCEYLFILKFKFKLATFFACFDLKLIRCKILFGVHKKVESWASDCVAYYNKCELIIATWYDNGKTSQLVWHPVWPSCMLCWINKYFLLPIKTK
jgi:hypothetical protein